MQAIPFGGFISALFILSSRYYTSAAYERPIHLGIFVLFITAVFSIVVARYSDPGRYLIGPLYHSLKTTSLRNRVSQLTTTCFSSIRSLPVLFFSMVGCIVVRILLFWVIVRTTQCSVLGIEAFLPFLVFVCDGIFGLDSSSKPIVTNRLGQYGFTLLRSFIAFLWGFAAISALNQFTTRTGAICPPIWQWRALILGAQVLSCVIDALLLVNLRRLHDERVKERTDLSTFAALGLFASVFITFILAFPFLLEDSDLFWTFCPPLQDFMDLVVESLLLTVAVLCAFSLLQSVRPAVIALLISSLSLFGYHIPMVGLKVSLPLARSDLLSIELVTAILFWALCCFELHSARTLQPLPVPSKHQYIAVMLLGIFVLPIFLAWFLSDSSSISLSKVVEDLAMAANTRSAQWEEQATRSETLEDAVEEYKRRYGLLPPPNFDEWYKFALDNGSPVIDDFTQIHNDLLPFWSLEPRTIRERTAHLAEYSSVGVGVLRIRNGTVEYSPHIPGSHRWMMDSMQRMLEPFVEWLPDMDIAMNLGDECQMAIPFGEMREHKVAAQEAIGNMMLPGQKLQNSTTTNLNGSQWPSDFSKPLPTEVMSPFFSNNIRWQIYHDLVSPACPPSSLARRKRWWDWSTLCVDCMLPHTILTDEGALVGDADLANDLCHQPDIAYLNGFINTPAAMVGTNKLFPIFSQARVGGFSDIMIPSPWNFEKKSLYNETLDPTWDHKSEALFWRGSSSDGYAAFTSWMGFLRARFVHESHKKATGGEETLAINVSFSGTIHKCHQADCATEQQTFNKWASDMHIVTSEDKSSDFETEWKLLAPITPFEDNWKYRHLIDMDGAGFSGRFLPFLKSRSLVYRAGIFQAWFDERLTAWQHYIPLDLRLGSGVWALFDFLSGKEDGREHAQRIADQGRDWAQKALRPEDMQIYMFRLLLEWGRVVDDDREHLGFVS